MAARNTLDPSVITKLNALPADQVRRPTMPVDLYLQEAENLYSWAVNDRAALTAVGLDWALVEDITLRAVWLRDAQSGWEESRFIQEAAQKTWRDAREDGYELRDDMMHSFRFGFRDRPDLLGRVAAIAEGSSHADMIQDLNDLAHLGQSNTELLTAIHFDLQRLQQAAELADLLARLYAEANAERADDNQHKMLRDRAFTYLKSAVDQVREYGQFVFWKDPVRLQGYRSEYFNRPSRRNNSSDNSSNNSTDNSSNKGAGQSGVDPKVATTTADTTTETTTETTT